MDDNKKSMHREIERQRRLEMGQLCATLRSLLPLKYLKGKRSISDHMHEAVNYIKHLQNKEMQLQTKRDELMKQSNLSTPITPENESSTTYLPPCVVIHPLPGGVAIMYCYNFRNCVFPLSKVLHILLKEGLNVVTSTSTKTNGRFIHTIRSEDRNITATDYAGLQRKLTEAISSSSLQETLTEPENCLYREKDVLFGEFSDFKDYWQ